MNHENIMLVVEISIGIRIYSHLSEENKQCHKYYRGNTVELIDCLRKVMGEAIRVCWGKRS